MPHEATRHRPLPAEQRQLRLPGVRYELELDYKVSSNRLSGTATITAVTLASLKTFTLDLADNLSVGKVTVNGHAARYQFTTSAGKLRIRLAAALTAGSPMSIVVRYGGSPRPIRSMWGRWGIRGTHQRRSGGRSAQRRAVLVPLR